MSVRSAPSPSAGFVYKLLIITGFIAAAIGASTVVVISYNYITRDELRNPVPVEEHDEGGHGALPGWIVTI